MFPSPPLEIPSRELHSRAQWLGDCLSLCSKGSVGPKLAAPSPSSIPLAETQDMGTFFPSFFQSWWSCSPQARSLGSEIFCRNRGLEEHQPHRVQIGRQACPKGPLPSSVQAVPVLPVLRSPGLQFLPHGLEVLLDECLQLLLGNAVVVGGGQLTEALQDLVWGPGGKEGSGGPQEPLPDGGPSLPGLALCHLWCRSFRRWPRYLTWSRGQRHVHELLVILVELGHLHVVQELPVAVNLAADSVGEGGRSGHHH